jgi:S1-C subfamily serine protease
MSSAGFPLKSFPRAMKILRIFRDVCLLSIGVQALSGQDAQQIIDSAAKVYAEAAAYSANVDSRSVQFVFAPTSVGQPPRYDVRSVQFRRLQVRLKSPDAYLVGVQAYQENRGGMTPAGRTMPNGVWSFLARVGAAQPKQSVYLNGRFTVQDMPLDQFNAQLNSRLSAGDLVLKHFRVNDSARGNIPLGLLDPELIGRESNGTPTYRLAATTSDGWPVMLWVDQKSFQIVRSIVQRPFASRNPMPGMPPEMAARRSSLVVVTETIYHDQQLNPNFGNRDFVIDASPANDQPSAAQMGFSDIESLVKVAGIGSAELPNHGAVAGMDGDEGEPSASAPTPVATPNPATVNGQALSLGQMEGIVLIEGDNSTATGFMTKIRDVDFIVTNQHVLGDGKKLKFKTLRGEEIPTLGVFGAIGSDIAIIRVAGGQGELTVAKDVLSGSKIGDKVVVVGNRLGGGVATQTEGSIVGIGPTRIEVNANFEPGNSGSPIVNLGTGEVVGVATYSETRSIAVDDGGAASARGRVTAPAQVEKRWFGYRLDSVSKWEAIDLVQWGAQSERIEQFMETSRALHAVVRFDFRTARQHPRLTTILDQFEARYQNASSNSLVAANEVKDLFRVIRSVSETGMRDLENGPYYDYYRTSLYWETSIPAQLEYRKAIIDVLKKYEANSSQFLSRMRNGG